MMPTESELQKLAEDGKLAFQAGHYESAAQLFTKAVQAYTERSDNANAAEQKNNLSVALLKMGKPQEALDAAQGTEEIFSDAKDRKRQGMAVGNVAAALEALKRPDEAFSAYEHSAELFAQAGEADLRSIVLKSAAGIKFRRGKITESAFKMIGSLEAKEKPSIFERFLKFLLHFVQR